MLHKLGKIWRPAVFQGGSKKGNYFEGWFYKIVDKSGANTMALIPGLFIADNEADSHSFVMVLDAETHLSTYHSYPINEFSASSSKLDIRVGANQFRADAFEIHIDSEKRSVHGKISLGEFTPWPVTLQSPGVMGWYAYAPFMQCYHGVLSFDHSVDGQLKVNQHEITFDGGRGYIEKDWGQSFPSAYVWMQSNHFDKPGVSFMASVANVPWLRSSFRGFIIGLQMNGTLLRFATYTGAVLENCDISKKHVRISVQNKKYRLTAETERTDGGILHAPYGLTMTPKVSETLGSTIKLELYEKTSRGEKLVFSDTGRHAGLDVNGALEEIRIKSD